MSYWEELTHSVTEPGRHVKFPACEGNTVLGSAYGLFDHGWREAGRVGGMWVACPQPCRSGLIPAGGVSGDRAVEATADQPGLGDHGNGV